MSSLIATSRKHLLQGVTWDHTGVYPDGGHWTAIHELHPDVDIAGAKRSLQEFADMPLRDLAQQFDLLAG